MLIPTIFDDFPNAIPSKGILHIGGSECEEKELYHKYNIKDENILWIEALPELVEKHKNNNIINAVISNTDNEEVSFHITNVTQASSLLKLKYHKINHPEIYVNETRTVKTITLNTLYEQHNIPYDRYDVINIDIQGGELNAFKGATKILPHIKAIYSEVNVKEIYENNCFMHELDDYLQQYNFKRVVGGACPKSGWGDALYLKE